MPRERKSATAVAEPLVETNAEEARQEQLAERRLREQVEAEAVAEWLQTATIHQRMIAIIADLPAIGKTMENTQQHFKFRGFDQVMNELNPLLAKYGVVIVPRVLERVTDQRPTKSGGVMYEVNLHVEYSFYGANGDVIVGSAWGEGTDSGDKATNKAMTMAFKNVLHQAFAVNTEDTIDSDRTTDPETTGRASARPDVAVDPPHRAPQTWSEALARWDNLVGVKGDGSPWLEELMEKRFGVSTAGQLNPEQKRVIMVGFFSTLMLLEERYGDLTFASPVRPLIQAAFSEKNDGLLLAGPAWALDPSEHETRPTREGVLRAPESDPEPGPAPGEKPAPADEIESEKGDPRADDGD